MIFLFVYVRMTSNTLLKGVILNMKKWISGLTIIGSLLVVSACSNDEGAEDTSAEEENATEETASSEESGGAAAEGEQSSEGESAEGEGEQAEMPEPDLEDVPDVVAEVNGTQIEKPEFEEAYNAQFQQMAMMSQMSGEEVNQDDLKTQVADGLVSQELLVQEADNRELEASEEETTELLDQLTEQAGVESQEELYTMFEEQGMNQEEVDEQIQLQVRVDKLIAEEAGEIEPSEDELKELYDQQVEQLEQMETEEEPPSFDELKPQLEEQLVSQKEGEAAQKLVETLKEDAEIEMHV